MARIRFEEAPSGSDFSASPLVGLRQGFYVDRFTGDLIDPSPTNADRIADFNAVFGTSVSRVPDFVEVSTNIVVAPLAGRTRAICNVNIIFTGDSSLRPQADGAHLSCYNCKISMAAKTNIGENSVIGTHAEAITTNSGLREDPTYAPENGGVITGSSSWNAYGCDIQAIVLIFGSGSFTGGGNSLQLGGDIIGSEIYFGGQRNTLGNTTFWAVAAKEGGRWIDSEISMSPGPAADSTGVIIQYGAPTVVDQMVFRRFGFTIGQGAANAGPKLQVNPAVSDYFTLFAIQADGRSGVGAQGNIFHVVGFTTPPAVSGAFDQVIKNSQDGFVNVINGSGGAILYQGYEPEYYSDILLENPIQNVNARLYSTFAATANSSTATNFGSVPNTSVADRSGLALNFVQTARSDVNGRLASDQYSMNGSTFTNGYYDFLKFTPVGTQGSETFGSTYGLEQVAPAGVIFAPIYDIRGSGSGSSRHFVQNSSRFEQRSYRYDIDSTETVDGTELEINTEYPIVESTIVPTDFLNVRVKSSNVDQATNLPVLSFDDSTPASLQDISNAIRSAWSQTAFTPHYDSTDATFPDAGPFRANEYPVNIILSDTDPTVTGNITFAENGYGIGLLSSNILEVRVNTNQLAGLSDDIIGNDPTNIQSLDIGGRAVDGVTFNGATTGNFGAITGGANITTSDTDNVAVASIDGSSIDSVGQLTISGTTVESNVTSDRNAIFNGDINATAGDSGGTGTAGTNISCLNNTVNNYTFVSTENSTFTGSTLTGVTSTSGDNINLTNATASGSSFIAADNIDLTGTGTISSGTLAGDNIENITSIKLGDGNTYGETSRTATLSFTGLPTTILAIDLLSAGGGYDTEGTINISSATAVTVEVTADDVSKLNLPGIQQGVAYPPIGNVTFVYPNVATTETYTIAAVRNGRYAVRQTKAGVESVLVAPTDLVSGTNAVVTVSDFASTTTGTGFTAGDSVKVYLKYDSDIATQDIYVERIFTYTFGNGSQTAELGPEPQVLVGNIAASSAGTFAFSTDSGNTRFLQVTGRTTQVENQNESQGFAATIANHNDHFQAWYDNDTGRALVSYGVGSAFWDTDVITGTSGDSGDETLPGAGGSGTVTANVTRSQVMTRWFKNTNSSGPSTLFRNVTGPEWTILNSGNPPLGDVVTAVDISLNTNDKVDDIQRVSGYIASGKPFPYDPDVDFDKDDDTNLTPFE